MKFRTDRLADALCRVFLTARIEDCDPLGHQERGQWDVSRDGHIACSRVLRYVAVSHVRTAVNSHGRQVSAPWRKLQALIGHEDGREREALGRSNADVLHVSWRRVGVDPERHAHAVLPSTGKGSGRGRREACMVKDSPSGHTSVDH